MHPRIEQISSTKGSPSSFNFVLALSTLVQRTGPAAMTPSGLRRLQNQGSLQVRHRPEDMAHQFAAQSSSVQTLSQGYEPHSPLLEDTHQFY